MAGFVALLLLWEPPSSSAQEGKLQKVREEASRESPSSGGGDESKGCSCESDDGLGELFFYAAAYCVAAPYVLTAKLLGDDYNVHGYFLPYPYANGRPGSLQLHFTEEAEPYGPEAPVKWWLARFAVEESNDF